MLCYGAEAYKVVLFVRASMRILRWPSRPSVAPYIRLTRPPGPKCRRVTGTRRAALDLHVSVGVDVVDG